MPLKVNQIVCLEHQGNNLYGEVIQLITERQLCWFRPLCLVISVDSTINSVPNYTEIPPNERIESQNCLLSESKVNSISINTDGYKIINLQSGSDLLWPDSLFRPALDIEIIDFLPYLPENSYYSKIDISSKKYLNKFIHLVWEANQDKF